MPASVPRNGAEQNQLKITKSNIVCAEPMPDENEMLEEFVADLSFIGFAIGQTVFREPLVDYNTK
jgi:hypothetical protein